jgi:hypothetical protein
MTHGFAAKNPVHFRPAKSDKSPRKIPSQLASKSHTPYASTRLLRARSPLKTLLFKSLF